MAWNGQRAGRGCGKMAEAVAVESCVKLECTDIPRDVENATADKTAAPRRQPELYRFRATDLLYYASSVTLLFADVATDSIVCVKYLWQGQSTWGCFAISFTILPACVTQLFSLRWHRSDGSLRTIHWLLHLLLLGFLHRYLTLLYAAMHSLKNKSSLSKDKTWVYRQESDICMLHLFESFMGAAPQLILQLYIIAILNHAPLWTSASATASFCSLTWAVSTYVRAMHNISCERSNVTWIALVLQAFWRGGMLLSRIGVLVLAAVFLKTWFFLFLGLHWLFMTIWVILQKTKFCPTVWEERIYNCIIGLIYCFDFFNLRDGRSRYRMLVFYSVITIQNLFFLIMYTLHYKDTVASDTMIAITTVIIGCMLVGLASMSLYYGKFHPSKAEHSSSIKVDTSRSLKLFHRGSLVSLHHSIDISPRTEKEIATDKQSLLTNIAQISDCAEEGIVNRNYNSENESNTSSVRVSTECERPHSCIGVKHKEEITSCNDNPDNIFTSNASLSSLYPGLPDIDSSRKRRGIYEHDITAQLDWHAPDILNIDLDQFGSLDNSERSNSLTLDSCSKVIGALDIIKNRGKLTTPTPLESSKIFDIEKVSKDLQQQQRDETMSCVTSIHDYENVCPLGVARPPWCIRSWKGYTDIETYIHDDSVVRDRRRDTLTSTTGTTYSSEYSDGMISQSILKQDDYVDVLTYDLVESKGVKSSYSDSTFSTSTVDDHNASLYVAKPVVFDDRGGMLALDTIMEERDDSSLSDEKFQHGTESSRDSASTLVSTIDQIRRYTAENSPRHIYHTTGTQWEDINPKNLMARAHFAKVLFDNDLRNASANGSIDLTTRDIEKREIDAIREFVRCCAIESIKKTPLIDAILSDSPILGSRASKLVRQVTFADGKNNFDTNESDLYVEMSPLVSVENGENLCLTKSVDAKIDEAESIAKKSNLSMISNKSADKENLSPSLSNKQINNIDIIENTNMDDNDKHAWTTERDEKSDMSMCNMRFSLKDKRHLFLEQVLSPVPKLWNKRISFHPSTKNL